MKIFLALVLGIAIGYFITLFHQSLSPDYFIVSVVNNTDCRIDRAGIETLSQTIYVSKKQGEYSVVPPADENGIVLKSPVSRNKDDRYRLHVFYENCDPQISGWRQVEHGTFIYERVSTNEIVQDIRA